MFLLVIPSQVGSRQHNSNSKHNYLEYEKVIDELKNKALFWAYQSITTLPNDVMQASEQVATINGTEALYGALKLWQTMFPQDDLSCLPRPALACIIPTTHAQWNSTKGGSDTITKIVDDSVLHPPDVIQTLNLLQLLAVFPSYSQQYSNSIKSSQQKKISTNIQQ